MLMISGLCNLIMSQGQTNKSTVQPKPNKLPKLSIQEEIENQEIVDRMNRKISFAKNQRHLGRTMLYADAFQAETAQSKFRVDPQQLLFSNYQANHVYESQVRLINISKHIQRVKLAPLKVKQFAIFRVKYPREDSGDIAPGMSVTITIRFRPVSLTDSQDQLIAIVADGSVKVPIVAQRQPSDISWPNRVECGHCWVGECIKKQVKIKNKGGESTFTLVNCQERPFYKTGPFTVEPTELKFEPNGSQTFRVSFSPMLKGSFSENIIFKSSQGGLEQIVILLSGGAYNAQLTLEEIDGSEVLEQKSTVSLYLSNCEKGSTCTSQLKVKNLAVVSVDYFWHVAGESALKIEKAAGTMNSSAITSFSFCYEPHTRFPQNILAELYLLNLPEKSLGNDSVMKRINGVDAIQCLAVQMQTSPVLSELSILPLHKRIVQDFYQIRPVLDNFQLVNKSSTRQGYTIRRIRQDEHVESHFVEWQGVVEPNSTKRIEVSFEIKVLSRQAKKAYFLVQFENAHGEMISVEGVSTYPLLCLRDHEIYFGLVRTFTTVRKAVTITNEQNNLVYFRVHNPFRFYALDFYCFYQFDSEQFLQRRLQIYSSKTKQELIGWTAIEPDSSLDLICEYWALDEESIQLQIGIEIQHSQTISIAVHGEVRETALQLSQDRINLREIYKGNVYNSNKFLSRQLAIKNIGHVETSFEIVPPEHDSCFVKIDPVKGVLQQGEIRRLDLTIEPIKTGEFRIPVRWIFADAFMMDPESYQNESQFTKINQGAKKTLVKERQLQISVTVRGMEMNYYLKDETRVKRVRQKIEDIAQSVKMSVSSFKSSRNMHEGEKLVYPFLEQLCFYNCEINQVRQVQILIENDSELTTEYTIYAQRFKTGADPQGNTYRTTKGLASAEEPPFTSEMAKTFMKNRALERSQKAHLSSNKGISILCEPNAGTLHKKQTQKVIITMFNDTSGRFKDRLIVDVKNHEIRSFPIDIHIKGTPVALSRNQLCIDFRCEVPFMNLGTTLVSNGVLKKSLKVVNNCPKPVQLRWFIYPYNKPQSMQDLFQIEFLEGAPGAGNLFDLKWNALKPEPDPDSPFTVQPKQTTLEGREETNFTVLIKDLPEVGIFSNLLICQPILLDLEAKTQMEDLAVVLQIESVVPVLSMNAKQKYNFHKLELFAVQHVEQQTNSKNNLRKLQLKNLIRSNLAFEVSITSTDPQFESFRIAAASTDSPATLPQSAGAKQVQKSFVLVFDSNIEITIQLIADAYNFVEWPMEETVRKDGQLTIAYSNGSRQIIDLVGWLYRPWLRIQMPNQQLWSLSNCDIDFGTVHVKNSKKISVYLVNPSKVDAKWSISYLKYQQSMKYKFQESLWTKQDHEDKTIHDEPKCFRLSMDQGIVRNQTIPIHYIPSTLALNSADDKFAQGHKPAEVVFLFKPETNVLYKSRFRITVLEGECFDVVVKGRGTYDQQADKR